MPTKIYVPCECQKLTILDVVRVSTDRGSFEGMVVGFSRDAVQVGYRNMFGQYRKLWVEKDNVTRND